MQAGRQKREKREKQTDVERRALGRREGGEEGKREQREREMESVRGQRETDGERDIYIYIYREPRSKTEMSRRTER